MSISKENIVQAHQRISPYILKTPVLNSKALDQQLNCELFFKCENQQKIKAFKIRGAMNAVLLLPEHEKKKGVATHSSGNHAQAIALAAKTLGIKSWIVMPENSSKIKVEGAKGLGAEIIFCKPTVADREKTLLEVLEKTGAIYLPPYNHEHIIAGQGTAAKELLTEVPGLNLLFAPVGGGGLLSGTALSAHYFSPNTSVYGCEPENADDAYRSFHSGKIEDLPEGKSTIADGLRTTLGPITFAIIKEHVKGILTVTEEEIITAMKVIKEKLNQDIEPSSAVPVAALFKNKRLIAGKRVGIIISGGNV